MMLSSCCNSYVVEPARPACIAAKLLPCRVVIVVAPALDSHCPLWCKNPQYISCLLFPYAGDLARSSGRSVESTRGSSGGSGSQWIIALTSVVFAAHLGPLLLHSIVVLVYARDSNQHGEKHFGNNGNPKIDRIFYTTQKAQKALPERRTTDSFIVC